MKKHLIMNVNLAISLIIALGFFCMALLNYNTYSQIIDDDIKNISKLTSTNIYSEINNELTKPIFVSLTMANDSFLKNWLQNEDKTSTDKAYLQKLQDYLIGIKSKYHYNSVFMISEKTKYYYHYNGILKTVSEKDSHDKWYYEFINGNELYDLDVDQDQAAQNTLTVFVNCRVEDADGSLMAVVGVGVEINQLQALLKQFEDNFDLEAFLVDPNGLTQVHTDIHKIEKMNIFEQPSLAQFKDKITGNLNSLVTSKYKQENLKGYLITRYIDEMSWFLIIKKDTSILNRSFHVQLIRDMLLMLFILFLLLTLSTYCITSYKKHITTLAKTDELTKLPNRRAFNDELYKAIMNYRMNNKLFYVFVFDVDFFKTINDTNGHLFGDKIITDIAISAKNTINSKGMTARWGGDEFAGIIYGSWEEVQQITEKLLEQIRTLDSLKEYGITISLGITQVKESDNIDSMLKRADSGLYRAKSEGRNRVIRVL